MASLQETKPTRRHLVKKEVVIYLKHGQYLCMCCALCISYPGVYILIYNVYIYFNIQYVYIFHSWSKCVYMKSLLKYDVHWLIILCLMILVCYYWINALIVDFNSVSLLYAVIFNNTNCTISLSNEICLLESQVRGS